MLAIVGAGFIGGEIGRYADSLAGAGAGGGGALVRYPADPPSIEEIVCVMRCAGARPEDLRMCALMIVLWRAGLRISVAPWPKGCTPVAWSEPIVAAIASRAACSRCRF